MTKKSPKKAKTRRQQLTGRKPSAKGAKGIKVKPERGPVAKFFYWSAVAVIWGLILLVPVVLYYGHDLPDISDIKTDSGRSTIIVMDRDGERLATYGDVFGEWLTFEEFPVEVVQAVIATEDRRFFEHSGLDLRGLARAVVRNIVEKDLVEGGSTITQQLAKNLFLSADRTLKRKIQELLLSFWLEINFTKDEILTLYLNRVYFGSGAFGLDAASRTIFGHTARDLSLTEAAMLAGVLKGPALYSPLRDTERSYRRTEEVLDNMVEVGFISAETSDAAKRDNLYIVDPATGGDVRYFTDWIAEQIPDLIGQTKEPVVVYTTLIQKMQNMATGAIGQVLSREGGKHNAGQAALISMDTDGAVRALVGGRDYNQSQFNRAVQARRQPGSAFKYFVYLAALEQGASPDMMMRDSPVILQNWEPKNYTGEYLGRIDLKTAFAKSINTVAVKLAERTDRANVTQMARRLGITTPMTSEPSLSLGTSEVSLMELTASYGAIPNQGNIVKPYGIVEIQNSRGQILYRHMPGPPAPVLAPDVVAQMDEMLKTVVSEGTARQAQMTFPVGGKTGTTQDNKDAVFIGYGLDMINGVWVGNDDATPMKSVTGGGMPARIWKNFMYRVSLGRNDATLETPNVRPREKPGQ